MATPPDTPERELDEAIGPELDEAEWFGEDTLVAPPDATPLDEGGPGGPPAEPGPEHERRGRGPTWTQLLVAALAVGLLGGAIGYVIGKGKPPAEDSVDVGFLQDMIDHHEQGVLMARMVLDKEKSDVDPVVRTLAEEVILIQEREIGLMDAQLSIWGRVRGDLDREAMGWMGPPTTVATMPGMQTQEALDALDAAKGSDADRLFLTMMRDHHQGGVHMALDAKRHAGSKRVRDLATRIARSQSSEIEEYTGILRQMGLES